MAKPSVLEVFLHGDLIGTITNLPGDRNVFDFDDSYIQNDGRPTLSLSFKDEYGDLITPSRRVNTKLPPFFSNLLPEGHLRTYLARRAEANERREFPLLWVLGRDLPGALLVRPAEGEEWPPGGESRGEDRQRSLLDPDVMRFSLAGVQLKFSAIMGATGGLTIPAQGIGGSWIVKLPSGRFEGVTENEYAMMTLAGAAGIEVPEIRLVPVKEIGGLPDNVEKMKGDAFIIRRFDRSEQGPVHIEDFAQVFGMFPDKKYEGASYQGIAYKIWVETGEAGITEYIRRLVFNVLIGNADMHLKNWSFIYPDKHEPALAPAYDFVSTIAYPGLDNAMALSLMGEKEFARVTTDLFEQLIAKAGLPKKIVLDTVKETSARFDEVWAREASHIPLNQDIVAAINAHRSRIKL